MNVGCKWNSTAASLLGKHTAVNSVVLQLSFKMSKASFRLVLAFRLQ